MIIVRKRLIYWLIKEYIKKWGKTLFLSFVIGLIVFFALISLIRYFITKVPVGQKEAIGIVGAYTLESLPTQILEDISSGLTRVDDEGNVLPNIASSWKIENGGKRYVFNLRTDIYFTDNTNVTSDFISYNFSDAKITKPDKYRVIFELKNKYSPFLVTVSKPIFKKGFIGVGKYKIKDVKLNGNFIESLTLISTSDQFHVKIYQFYPNAITLKTAYMLGEITKAIGLPNLQFRNTSFTNYPNTQIKKNINNNQLVTLFFNTQDGILSDKRVRNGLTYAIPNEFEEGQRNYMPFSPNSWAYTQQYIYNQDITHARSLLEASNTASNGAKLTLKVKTLAKYKATAEKIIKEWREIGVNSSIEAVDSIPPNFQIFLGDFFIPKDPDQYMLWHSKGQNNITKFEVNKRIDKLLEDGREKSDLSERKKIYTDFQKYLLADSPAAFLYFPYEYEITRK